MHPSIRRALVGAALPAVLLGAAAPIASADAEGPLHNYGMCVAQVAMSGEDPVREFTQFFDPLTDVQFRILVPHGGQGIPHGCLLPGS
jgi:hypothetical protein